MPWQIWQPGAQLESPVYLDSNVLVAGLVRRDVRYRQAAGLLGELLASKSRIIVSLLTLSESLWAIAKLSYGEIYNQPSNASFRPEVYRRHHAEIFGRYQARFYSVHSLIRDWRAAGIEVDLVPPTIDALESVSSLTPAYMEEFQLSSADASHLAAASDAEARSFVTTDREFERAEAIAITIVRLT
jgi:predicted nucleic acid-binding protein